MPQDMPHEITLLYQKQMVIYRSMQEWNVLPEQITQESRKMRFKSLVKNHLLIRDVE